MINNKPSVYVILVNWNTAKVTIDCIHSILRSDYKPVNICLIDNGSAEKEVDILRKGIPDCVSLHCMGENLGYVGGVNYALKMAESAKPEYILIMNNDTLIDPTAIQELVSTSERRSNKCLVTGKVLDYNKPDVIQQIGAKLINRKILSFEAIGRNEIDKGQYDYEMELDLIDDVMWIIPYPVFKQVGFYNSMFWFNAEQADFAFRAVKEGNKLIFCPKAKIWHKGSHSIGGRNNNPALSYWNAQSSVILRSLHLTKYWFVISLIQMTYNAVYAILRRFYRKELHKNGCVCPELRGILSGLAISLRRTPNTGHNPYL